MRIINFLQELLLLAKTRYLKFRFKWFSNCPWLVLYSAIDNRTYCTFCVAFSKYSTETNNQSLGSLAIKKLHNWRHALEYFKNHWNLEYP